MGCADYKYPFRWDSLYSEIVELCNASQEFMQTDDYRKWAADKPPEFNAFAYLEMVKEREHAYRLEF